MEMAVEEREISALSRLGLNEYESRIYLVLVRMGPIKAGEVSFFGQVPRTKTYGAIRELERKGLLMVIPGKPELYAPSSPGEALTPLVTKRTREIKETEDLIQALTLTYESTKYVKRETPKAASEVWEIEGRQSLFNKVTQIMKDAQTSINYCTSGLGIVRAYKAHAETLENAKTRGVTVRFLAQVTKESQSLARELGEIIDMKTLDKPFASSFISVDGRELVVMENRPDDVQIDRGSDVATWTTNSTLVAMHEHLFERIWNSLPTQSENAA